MSETDAGRLCVVFVRAMNYAARRRSRSGRGDCLELRQSTQNLVRCSVRRLERRDRTVCDMSVESCLCEARRLTLAFALLHSWQALDGGILDHQSDLTFWVLGIPGLAGTTFLACSMDLFRSRKTCTGHLWRPRRERRGWATKASQSGSSYAGNKL